MKRKGKYAETYFANLCAKEGIVCNPSVDDQNGWDFIIEFPLSIPTSKATDLTPASISALVQIKSTTQKKNSTRLKLSNALKATKTRLPFFIVFMKFSEKKCEPQIFLKHFWKEEMIHTLKRVRTSEEKGRDKLNRQTLTVKFDSDVIPEENLIARIKTIIESVGENYHEEKRSIDLHSGFEDGGILGKFEFPKGTHIEEFIDHFLGLKKRIPFKSWKYANHRFGISSTKSTGTLKDGFLEVTPSLDGKCIGIFKNTSGESVVLNGAALYPPKSLNLPDKYQKINFRFTIFNFIFSRTGIERAKLSEFDNEKYLFDEVLNILQILQWGERGDIDLTIFNEKGLITNGKLTISCKTQENIWANMFTYFKSFEHAIIPDKNNLMLSMVDLFSAYENLEALHAISNSNRGAKMEVTEVPEIASSDFPEIVTGYMYIVVGDFIFMRILERPIIEHERMIDGCYSLVLGDGLAVQSYIIPKSYENPFDILEKGYDDYLASNENDRCTLNLHCLINEPEE